MIHLHFAVDIPDAARLNALSLGSVNNSTPKARMKSTLLNFILVGLMALAVATARAQDNEAAKPDQAKLQGAWTMVSGERDGQSFPSEYLTNSERIVKGGETTVTVQGQLFMKAKFSLDPSKTPKTIDYAINGGPYAGLAMHGIYELDGDQVKFCLATPGKERPTGFATKPDGGQTMTVWKRKTK
jgi:uncharacterized protein (TIGR03067 family)